VEAVKNGMMFSGMGFELVALCLGGYYLGDTISQHYGITKSVTAFVILALLVAWFVHLIYLLRKFEDTDDSDSGNQP